MELFSAVWLCLHLLAMAVEGNTEYHPELISVSVPYVTYICPEGANVTMVCEQSGTVKYPSDHLQHLWAYTPHIGQRCEVAIRKNKSEPFKSNAKSFSVTLWNVTQASKGRYCCVALDMHHDAKHKPVREHVSHSHMILIVTQAGHNESLTCQKIPPPPPQGTVAAGLATAACIMGILCLPVLLILVYRQRQRTHSSRRAHELVRMDSEAQGHENPLYTGDSPQPPTRTVAQILTRQSSETGRHLLSDPGTPFSSTPQGDVFFPAHEPIPETLNFQPL